jgi:hypothetical protein
MEGDGDPSRLATLAPQDDAIASSLLSSKQNGRLAPPVLHS